MGIIKSQTIKGTVFSYAGVLLGFAISGLLLPRLFSPAENGLLKLLIAYSSLFAQFGTMGFSFATARMFSFFRDEKTLHHGYIAILNWVLLVGFAISLFVFFVFNDWIIQSATAKSELFVQYSIFLLPLIFFNLQFLLLDTYFKMLFKTVRGTFLKELALRMLVLSSIGLYFFDIIGFDGFIVAYVASNAMPGLMLMLLLGRNAVLLKPDFSYLNKNLVYSIAKMSFYGIIMGFSGVMILNIDSVMISRMLDLDATGIYAITFFFGTLVIIPSRALRKIAGTVLADAWRDKQMETIKKVYQKSSLNQLIAGSFLFAGLWANIDNVFKILPAPYEAGMYVIFFIALANLIEMFSGVSDILIQTSRDYRYAAALNVVFLIMVILFNYLLISLFGITGAAMANAVAFALNSLLRFAFIYKRYGFHPFSPKLIYVVLFAVVAYFAASFLPEFNQFLVDIFLRLVVVTVVFGSSIYFFRLSDDLNETINGLLNKWGWFRH